MAWFQHPVFLEGEKVQLQPLQETHFAALQEAAGNENIWTWMPIFGMQPGALAGALQEALQLKEKKQQYPFIVIDKATGKIIGSTRYLQINEEHKNLEIGWTWYNPGYWSKGYNEECKLLLLTHCFETLGAIRVQITAWDKNQRSRKAIQRIGATFEGVLRNAWIRRGEVRNQAFYSIIDEEWPAVKQHIAQLKRAKYDQPV